MRNRVMTTNENDLDTAPCRSSKPENLEDVESDIDFGPGCGEISLDERSCDICQRPVSELKAFDWPDDPVIGHVFRAKLRKSYRWDYPHHVGSTRECRDCIVRPEPIWWILAEEERLGRRLTDIEIKDVQRRWDLEAERYELELSLLAMDEEMNLPESGK